MAMAFVPGLSAGRPVGGPPAFLRVAGGWSPQADSPIALADLDLAEVRRRQLRDQCGQEIVDEAADPRVIREAVCGLCIRHGSDLLVRGRLIAP
jgi:hypothetical protein